MTSQPLGSAVSRFDYAGRIGRARREMDDQGVDCLLLSVGSDMPYLIGYEAPPLERLTMLVVPLEGQATLVVPRLEAPRVVPGPFEILPFDELDDPVSIVARLAGRPTVAALGDQTWSLFLIRLTAFLVETVFVPASSVTSPLRAIKEPAEIESLRAAAAATDRVSVRIPGEIKFREATERSVARAVLEMTLEEGHQMATFGIVASGPNAASPHHEPGDRVIESGDAVVIDFGGKLDGYCSDTTRTFVVGPAPSRLVEIHGVVHAAQEAGRSTARAGVTAESVDAASRRVIDDAGYGEWFIHRLGHGIGLDVHEDPYLVAGNDTVLAPGHAFSIEPGIYLPGEMGVRIEDIAVIGPDGELDVLNNSLRELIEVG